MEQSRVRVAGPSRVVLVASTTALVAVSSLATALVVLTGAGGVASAVPSLEPLPAAAAPAMLPVVVLPPGALGVAAPETTRRAATTTRPSAASSRSLAATPLILALSPILPAGGLLPPGQLPTRSVVAARPPSAGTPVIQAARQRPGRSGATGPATGGELDGVLAAPTTEPVPDTLDGTTAALTLGGSGTTTDGARPVASTRPTTGPAVPKKVAATGPAVPKKVAATGPAVRQQPAATGPAVRQQPAATGPAVPAKKAAATRPAATRPAAAKPAPQKAQKTKAAPKKPAASKAPATKAQQAPAKKKATAAKSKHHRKAAPARGRSGTRP